MRKQPQAVRVGAAGSMERKKRKQLQVARGDGGGIECGSSRRQQGAAPQEA